MSLDEQMLDELLRDTAEDWSSLAWVFGICWSVRGEGTAQAREDTLALLQTALVELELVRAGDPTDDGRFLPWPESAEESMSRIRRYWVGREEDKPDLDGDAWFELTERGRRRARQLQSDD